MTLTRKDAVAAVLTALAVLAFVATHQSWNVWLIGSSHRWAAGAIMVLGALTCGLGSAQGHGQGRGDEAARRNRSRIARVRGLGRLDRVADAALAAGRLHRRPLGGLDDAPRLAPDARTDTDLDD